MEYTAKHKELSIELNFSFHIIQFTIILKYNYWTTTPSNISILVSIKSYLNLYTVHSFKFYDITTKIAFTKNQLSPDNS